MKKSHTKSPAQERRFSSIAKSLAIALGFSGVFFIAFAADVSQQCPDGSYISAEAECKPQLSVLSTTPIADTTATIRVTTDKDSGTLYSYFLPSVSGACPTVTQNTILASGTAQGVSDSQVPQTRSLTGLSPSTAYCPYFLHSWVPTNGAVAQLTPVLTGNRFTTNASGGGGGTQFGTGLGSGDLAAIPNPTETNAQLTALGHTPWPYDPRTIQPPSLPSPWTSSVPGFYFVNDDVACSNTTNGAPSGIQPRCTMPTTGVPAGSVIVVDGIYNTSHDPITFTGTSTDPIFVLRNDDDAKSIGRLNIGDSTHVIVELSTDGSTGSAGTSKIQMSGGASFVTVRNTQILSDQLRVGFGGLGVSGNHIMVYNVLVQNAGDIDVPTDQDTHGIKVSPGASDVWIIGSKFIGNSGDGVQVGDNVGTSMVNRVWIYGNEATGNRQTGFWNKTSRDVVYINNTMYENGAGQGVGSSGAGSGGQYDDNAIWWIANTIHDENSGLQHGSRGAPAAFTIGGVVANLIYNTLSPVANTNDANEEAAFQNRGMSNVHIVHNTFVDSPSTAHNAPTGSYFAHGNIFGQPIDVNGRSFYAPLITSGSMDHNIYETPEEISWATNLRRTLSEHQAATGFDANSLSVSAAGLLFTNRAARDYTLQAASPAVDASVRTQVYTDYFNRYGKTIEIDRNLNPRPASGLNWDAGAFERQ